MALKFLPDCSWCVKIWSVKIGIRVLSSSVLEVKFVRIWSKSRVSLDSRVGCDTKS